MTNLPARAIAVSTDLADYQHLPIGYLHVGHGVSIGMPSNFFTDLSPIREVAQWAKEFSTELILSMSSGGAIAETTISLGGSPVSVKAQFGTAQAYELGRILQRELNRDVSIHIGADELLAAIEQVVSK